MGSNLGGVALFLSVVAVGVGGYALMSQEGSDSAALDERMTAIEDQLARIEVALAERGTPSEREPRLLGRADPEVTSGTTPRGDTPDDTPDEAAALAGRMPGSTEAQPSTQPVAGTAEEIEALVNKAVAKKADQMQVMRNKKPSADVFAKTLELSDVQRKAAEEEVVRAQHRIKEILDIPAEDGTNFTEELVEVMARGIAEPGKDPGRGMKFFGRILSEKIPGTDETYAARIETVKQGVRDTFKRDWTKKQYATFEAWQMDPTEVQNIPGSPWKELETRILDRAKQLGAEIPERGDDD